MEKKEFHTMAVALYPILTFSCRFDIILLVCIALGVVCFCNFLFLEYECNENKYKQ